MAVTEINLKELKAKLQNLRGVDFEEAEKIERETGNVSFEISMSKSFQIRLAAMALGVNPHDLKELPLPTYTKVALEVFNCLFSSAVEQKTDSDN